MSTINVGKMARPQAAWYGVYTLREQHLGHLAKVHLIHSVFMGYSLMRLLKPKAKKKKFMKSSTPYLLVVTFLLITQISFGQDVISKTVLKELEDAERIMFEKIPKFDPEYFKNYVHKDYITINADGVMKTREETLADSARKKMFEGVSCKLFDRKVRLHGNVAIINGRSQYLLPRKSIWRSISHRNLGKRKRKVDV